MMSNSEIDQQIAQEAFEDMLSVSVCWLRPDNTTSLFGDEDDQPSLEFIASVKIASALFLVDQALGRERSRVAYDH
jgi:hypothetical protein